MNDSLLRRRLETIPQLPTSRMVWPCSWSLFRRFMLRQESGTLASPIAQEFGCTCSSPVIASSSSCMPAHADWVGDVMMPTLLAYKLRAL